MPLRISPGGPFLVPPPAPPPPPLPADEESDAWWAGAQQCFTSVPRAAAAAVLGVAIATSGSFLQQDEVVPWVGVEAAPTTQSMAQRVRATTTFLRWDQAEELPAAAALEEEYQLSLVVRPTLIVAPLLGEADELQSGLEEVEGASLVALRVNPQLAPPWAPDDELSRGPVIEEEYAPELRLVVARTAPQVLVADEEVVAAASFSIEETDWQPAATLPLQTKSFVYLPDSDEPAGFTAASAVSPDAAGAPYGQRLRHAAVIKAWGGTDDFAIPAAPGVPDEEIWTWQPAALQAVLRVTLQLQVLWAPGDDLVTPAVPAVPADEPWTELPAPKVDLTGIIWATDEEIIPQLNLQESDWQVDVPPLARAVVFLPAAGDEIVPQPTPLHVNEEYWYLPATALLPVHMLDLTGAELDTLLSSLVESLNRTLHIQAQQRGLVIARQVRRLSIDKQGRILIITAQVRKDVL